MTDKSSITQKVLDELYNPLIEETEEQRIKRAISLAIQFQKEADEKCVWKIDNFNECTIGRPICANCLDILLKEKQTETEKAKDEEVKKLEMQISQDEMIIEDIARIVGMNPKEYIDGAELVTRVSEIRQATAKAIFEKIEKITPTPCSEDDGSDFAEINSDKLEKFINKVQQLKKEFGVEEK